MESMKPCSSDHCSNPALKAGRCEQCHVTFITQTLLENFNTDEAQIDFLEQSHQQPSIQAYLILAKHRGASKLVSLLNKINGMFRAVGCNNTHWRRAINNAIINTKQSLEWSRDEAAEAYREAVTPLRDFIQKQKLKPPRSRRDVASDLKLWLDSQPSSSL